MASDGGSGVLILRGVTGRLLRKSAQPNKVPLASKTSTDSAVPVSRSGFPPDDAAFDESGPTKHAATDLEEGPPQAEAEITVPVSFGYDLSETHIVLSLSYFLPWGRL